MAEDEPSHSPSNTLMRVDNLESTFRAARIEPSSVASRDAWGADRDWLREQRARHEQWSIRRSQILTGAAVALFTAALSIFGPWLIRVITHGAP